MSDAQSKATIKYVKKNYDRVEVRFRKEEEIPKKIKIHCEKYNYRDEYNRPNKSMLFRKALDTQMKVDSGEYELVKRG